ncbi:MAG: MiaB/RimO family radical SAM methylthiotransferase [Desulfovibrionaceae bacterium]
MTRHRFHIATLGCKINQYESQALREAWCAMGWTETGDPALAGTVIVNSCAVTQNAIRDLRQTVRRLHRANPGAAIIVTGCAGEVLADELATLPGVTEVVPQSQKRGLLVARPPAAAPQSPQSPQPAQPAPQARQAENAATPDFAIASFERARPVVKVQDGCSHRCAYCIVPLTRGPSRSRDPRAVHAEVARLLDAGFREIILSGVNLSHYGRDLAPATDFWDLVAALDAALAPQWDGQARLRISSVYPGQLSAKGLDTLAASRLVCPHLHLSLQSGSPAVLHAMGRGATDPAAMLGFLDQLRAHWPVFGCGADLIAGFPGETEAQHAESLAVVKALPLTYAHVFPYSPRPDTPAAGMPGQVADAAKKARAAALRAVAARRKGAFIQRVAALPLVHVAVEGGSPARGMSEYYVECRFESEEAAPHTIVASRPVAVEGGVLVVGEAGQAKTPTP